VPTVPAAVGATAGGDTAAADPAAALEESVDDGDHTARATSGDVVVGAGEVQVRLVGETTDAALEAWTTHATADDATAVANLPVTTNNLVIGTRADWGAD